MGGIPRGATWLGGPRTDMEPWLETDARGDTMRLAAKWQGSWRWMGGFDHGQLQPYRVPGGWVDVIRMGRGEPLVLVPGLAGSWKLVWPLARELARHCEVFLPGLRGDQGDWSSLGELPGQVGDIAGSADDLASLIDHLGLGHPTVFGISYGGAVALELAAHHPESLGGLIVYGAEGRFHRTLGSSIARRVLERFPLPSDNRFVNQFFHLLYGAKPEPGPLVDFVVERIWETDQSVIAERLAQLESFDVSDRLWRIEMPTLVLAGGRDVIVPAARQRALAQDIAGARFETIEDAGHIGFLTHRADVARSVCRHLRQVEAAV
jgi:pimeloyl-ACP methyl ester carboxylesterase